MSQEEDVVAVSVGRAYWSLYVYGLGWRRYDYHIREYYEQYILPEFYVKISEYETLSTAHGLDSGSIFHVSLRGHEDTGIEWRVSNNSIVIHWRLTRDFLAVLLRPSRLALFVDVFWARPLVEEYFRYG